MCEVVTTFDSDLVAAKACELLSVAFPMLTFELRFIPELPKDFTSGIDWNNTTFGVSNDK